MSRRMAVGAITAGTLILALAGCGSTGGSADKAPGGVTLSANEVLLKTSQKSATVNSFGADVTVDSTGEGGGSTHFNAKVRLRPDVALTSTVDKLGFGGFALNSAVPVVYLNNTVYLKVPSQLSQFSQFTGGKPWVRIDVAKAGQERGVDTLSALKQGADLIDPGNLTKSFTASKDASKVGDETIDGVTTTHYKGSVTVKEALASLDGQTQQRLQKVYDRIGSQKIAFDLWADGQQLARKVALKGSGDHGGSIAFTVVYSDFGTPVSVSPPPAGEVGDLTLPAMGR